MRLRVATDQLGDRRRLLLAIQMVEVHDWRRPFAPTIRTRSRLRIVGDTLQRRPTLTRIASHMLGVLLAPLPRPIGLTWLAVRIKPVPALPGPVKSAAQLPLAASDALLLPLAARASPTSPGLVHCSSTLLVGDIAGDDPLAVRHVVRARHRQLRRLFASSTAARRASACARNIGSLLPGSGACRPPSSPPASAASSSASRSSRARARERVSRWATSLNPHP
jgi:hypothetical protein